jgi:hypothetical protein
VRERENLELEPELKRQVRNMCVYTCKHTAFTHTHLYTCIGVKNRRRSEKRRRGNQRKATAEAEEKKGAVDGTGNGGCGAVEIETKEGATPPQERAAVSAR